MKSTETGATEQSAPDPWAALLADMASEDRFHVLVWELDSTGHNGCWYSEQGFGTLAEARALVNTMTLNDRMAGRTVTYAIERRLTTREVALYQPIDTVYELVGQLRKARAEATQLLLDGKEFIGPNSVVWSIINKFDQLDLSLVGTPGWPDALPEDQGPSVTDPVPDYDG